MILDCNKCDLHNHGSIYEGKNPKYLIISESSSNAKLLLTPNKSDLWSLFSNHGFRKIDFKIIHSINCFIKNRPSEYHRDLCRINIKNMIQSFNPEIILIFGNFALHTLTGKWGVKKIENKIENKLLFGKYYKVMYLQNQNIMLHSDNIKKSIEILKNHLKGG